MTAVYQQVQQQNASLLTLSNAINLLSPNPSVIVQVEGANSLYTSPHIIHSSSFSKQPQQNLVSDLANHRLHSPSAIPSTPSVGLKTSLEVSNLLPSPVASSSATTSSSFRFPYRTFNPKSSLEIVSRLEAVHQRETQLLQQLKQHLHQSEPLTLPSTASNFSVQLLSQELHALLEEKNQVLASLCSIPFQSGVEKENTACTSQVSGSGLADPMSPTSASLTGSKSSHTVVENVIELNSCKDSHLPLKSKIHFSFLRIEQQPTGNPPIVANKYIEPPFVLHLTEPSLFALAKQGLLRVSARLFFTLSDEPANKTLDGRQDLLQGQLSVPVLSDGSATFNKLKIIEVSSKHHHQSFCIYFQLEQIDPYNLSTVIPLGKSVKSLPLHVQSRITKRKRLPSEIGQTEVVQDNIQLIQQNNEPPPPPQQQQQQQQITQLPSLEESPIRPRSKRVRSHDRLQPLSLDSTDANSINTFTTESHSTYRSGGRDSSSMSSLCLNLSLLSNSSSSSSSSSSTENSSNLEISSTTSDSSNPNSSATTPSPRSPRSTYIDITDLLTLPQKEAAAKLGISESMLCKRFKECTRRKWPYRYLRKLDKMINAIQLHRATSNDPADEEKLKNLLKEREECLMPVRIRLTGSERNFGSEFCGAREEGSGEETGGNDPNEGIDQSSDDEIAFEVVETLEMLKRQALF